MRHAISLLAKKHIMIRAWHIARYAQKKHGGKPKQYMSQALRKSWTEWKEW